MSDQRLQTLWDHHEIRELLARYCHGCDRADEVAMAATYHEDSLDDHGPRKLPGKPFSIATVAESLETTDLVSHLLGQSLIRVDGDTAGAETYFIATLLYPPKQPGELQTIGQLGGRYVDTLVRSLISHWPSCRTKVSTYRPPSWPMVCGSPGCLGG
jgi:hypothetical protein